MKSKKGEPSAMVADNLAKLGQYYREWKELAKGEGLIVPVPGREEYRNRKKRDWE